MATISSLNSHKIASAKDPFSNIRNKEINYSPNRNLVDDSMYIRGLKDVSPQKDKNVSIRKLNFSRNSAKMN